MRKATIYFNGSVICTVSFEKLELSESNTLLTKGFGQDRKVLAIIPSSHLIVFEL